MERNKSANVLLVNPTIQRSEYKTPYLGIAYVGAALKRAGHEVTFLDGCLSKIDADTIVDVVAHLQPDYVGVAAFTLQYFAASRILRSVKGVNREITTILGSHHASALPEYTLKDVPEIDFVIKGEGEVAFPALIKALATGEKDLRRVPGLAFRENGGIVVNPASPIADIDSLEYPWLIVNPLDYAKGMGHGFMTKRPPGAPVISSRGCPYKCTYCAGPLALGRKLRLRDPRKFANEIEYLITNFGIREIQIVDDNFTFYAEHAAQVCREILSRGLDIAWSLPNGIRADRVDYALLKLMREAGCYYLAYGIEFGSERMLRLVHKGLNLTKARDSVAQAAKLGYITQGFFMMGHPQERKEDVLATIDVALKLPLDRISVNTVVPLPGTELFQHYLEKGYLDMANIDWEQFAGPQFIPKTEFLDHKDLIGLLRASYTQFYLSPGRILKYLFKLRSLTQIKGLWAGVTTLFTSVVRRGKW